MLVIRTLALLALTHPETPVRKLARLLPRLCDLDEKLECRSGVGHDTQIGAEYAPDLGWLDIHMDKLATLGVHLDRTGGGVRTSCQGAGVL